MTLWNTYQHCESGSDLDAMHSAARHLNQVAYQASMAGVADIPLPNSMKRWVSEPPARLAVDPKAMAAACSLYTGQAALSAGRPDVADEMFRAVLKNPAGTSAYYANQAREGLAQVGVIEHVSLKTPNPTVRTVAFVPALEK